MVVNLYPVNGWILIDFYGFRWDVVGIVPSVVLSCCWMRKFDGVSEFKSQKMGKNEEKAS